MPGLGMFLYIRLDKKIHTLPGCQHLAMEGISALWCLGLSVSIWWLPLEMLYCRDVDGT